MKNLSKTVAVVGVAEADEIGRVPHKSALTLHMEAAHNALEDAGLKKSDVDGLLTAGLFNSAQLAEYLGITPRYTDSTSVGGCSFLIHVEHAMAAINAGLCEVALITHGESGYSQTGYPRPPLASSSPQGQFEVPYGIMGPPSTFSIPVLRHMHQYGTTHEQLAEIAVATRKWAMLNPKALMRSPITIEDVLNSRWVCYPFHLLDCCLVTDAGGAAIVTSVERARDLRKKPIYVLGTGEGTAHWLVSMMRDFTTSDAARISGKRAFEMSGVRHEDIDVVELYDAFTFTPLLALEDLGFCKPGEGGSFVSRQRTAPGGDFPMNTNGGGLSYTHSGMYGMFVLIEGVRQLRGEGGDRQVKDAKIGLCHGPGGMFAAASTVILSNE